MTRRKTALLMTLLLVATLGYTAWSGTEAPFTPSFIRFLKGLQDGSVGVPSTGAAVFSVTTYGADPADGSDDRVAIQATIDAAPDGSIIYFPAGTWNISTSGSTGMVITDRSGLTFRCAGWTSIIKRSHASPANSRIATATRNTDITIENCAFDVNGITSFGGFVWTGSTPGNTRIHLRGNRCFDSNVDATTSNDRYCFLVTGAGGNSHFYIDDNRFEDVQLEVDTATYVWIRRNYVIRPRWWGCIGVFSQTQAGASHYEITDNTCVDADTVGGIGVMIDPSTNDNVTYHDFLIARNRIISVTAMPSRGIDIGAADIGEACTSNAYTNFRVEDNEIYIDPALTSKSGEGIFLPGSASCTPDLTFTRFKITGNRILDTGAKLVECLDLRLMVDGEVSNNICHVGSGGSSGRSINITSPTNVTVAGNVVIGSPTTAALSIQSSLGGNRVFGNRFIGSPGTPFTVSTPQTSDFFEDFTTPDTIASAGAAIESMSSVRLLDVTSTVTLTSTPSITDGLFDGQLLTLVNVNATNTMTLQDEGTLTGSNVYLGTATLSLAPRHSIDLVWSTTLGAWSLRSAGVPAGLTHKSANFSAGSLEVDGTNCTAPTSAQLNSGPIKPYFVCTDNNSSIFYGGLEMPSNYTGGPVRLKLVLWHATTETITFAGDFSAQCGPTANNTWGTAVAGDVPITTGNDFARGAAFSTVTPSGTCAARQQLNWRYVVDATNFSANAANARVIEVQMEYPVLAEIP